ncbi:MAG TPA: class I SAM-dependent methyltransferase [Ilumatobacteraceae bacterium]|nr:class I SAM-dependent methyltransferase [Ilumatobacteraceae bacterium]
MVRRVGMTTAVNRARRAFKRLRGRRPTLIDGDAQGSLHGHVRHWSDVHGWFQWRAGQEQAVEHFPAGARFVEVGVYLGRSICSLAEVVTASGKDITLIGVDTCLGSGPEGPAPIDYHGDAVADGRGTLAGTLHRNLIACGAGQAVTLIVGSSVSSAALFADRSLDWVHLDASHDEPNVRADIQAWLPKVRPGGWLSGDDYLPEQWPGVVSAVTELLPDARPWDQNQWRYEVPEHSVR